MRVLVDENLPKSFVRIFATRGWRTEHVQEVAELRSQPDEVLFDYAAAQGIIIVTRDVRFASLIRFPLERLPGMMILRFPHTISIRTLYQEVHRLIGEMEDEDFNGLVVIEPGAVRKRPLK